RPPGGKGERAVGLARGVQYHQGTVEPAASAMYLPLGQRVNVREWLSRLCVDDGDLEWQAFEGAGHRNDFAGLLRGSRDGRRETGEQDERHRASLHEADHISSMSHRPRLSLRK